MTPKPTKLGEATIAGYEREFPINSVLKYWVIELLTRYVLAGK
jgi:hypothetical protein